MTTVGALTTCRRLLGMFVYIDAVVVDTPIVDAEVAAKLADLRDVKERLGCARDFIAYLDGQWSMVSGVDHPFSWPASRDLLQADIE
jgi:hypothetical protein